MDGTLVAWVALGSTVLVQAVGIGIFIGVIRTEVRGLRRDLDAHRDLEIPRAHSYPSSLHANPPVERPDRDKG